MILMITNTQSICLDLSNFVLCTKFFYSMSTNILLPIASVLVTNVVNNKYCSFPNDLCYTQQ